MLNKCMHLTFAALASLAFAEPISLQGRVDGVTDGDYSITLRFWDAGSNGSIVYSSSIETNFIDGLFSITAEVPDDTFNGARWWDVSVPGAGTTNRTPVASVPRSIATRGILVDENSDVFIGPGAPRGGFFSRVTFEGPGDSRLTQDTRSILRLNGPSDGSYSMLAFGRDDIQKPTAAIGVASTGEGSHMAFGTSNSYATGITNFGLSINQEGQVIVACPEELAIDGIARPFGSAALSVYGRVTSNSLQINGGSDLAEPFPASSASSIVPIPGMVLSIDPLSPGALRVSERAYDTTVAGVYSGGNGLPTGLVMGKDGCELTGNSAEALPLAMTGRVWVFADDSNGEIVPGDRLTTSGANPGYAMKATDGLRAGGSVIGKAMTPIDPASGMVLVLVNLQ